MKFSIRIDHVNSLEGKILDLHPDVKVIPFSVERGLKRDGGKRISYIDAIVLIVEPLQEGFQCNE